MQLRTLIITMACAASLYVTAQSECGEYWRSAPRSNDARFSVNGQSRAASVQVGVPTELNIIIYKGQDYRISLAYDEKILGDRVAIRIIEKVRGPKKAAGSKEVGIKGERAKPEIEDVERVIWDNQEHDMANEVEFTATSTKRIAIEVMAPGAPESSKDARKGRTPPDIGCLGILIEHMPTPSVGF